MKKPPAHILPSQASPRILAPRVRKDVELSPEVLAWAEARARELGHTLESYVASLLRRAVENQSEGIAANHGLGHDVFPTRACARVASCPIAASHVLAYDVFLPWFKPAALLKKFSTVKPTQNPSHPSL